MKLIVGLGNPGKAYIHSRHNIGFRVLEALAKLYKVPLKKDNITLSLIGKGKIEGQKVILAMPLTFMNLSGFAVATLLKKYKTDDLDNLLVVCDDLDLGFGRLKIRPAGSSGGHLGLRSIIDSLKNDKFARLRIGVGRPKNDVAIPGYVLSPFTKKEKKECRDIIEKACHCCAVWLSEGISKTMNIFNRHLNIILIILVSVSIIRIKP